ncbi:transcription elongation factor 1 [Cantharellus anzutake]|uniref:transcription elongation factor 1 n=1 Tax=Cantharellus anzutake TaxID=1750568 RepID=UPI001903AE95|nr:transcription elongation factor 1 [Cantharellus anzutake]KAF8334001.1 transcription elongation factor 1 [Cantharellus anzutake]
MGKRKKSSRKPGAGRKKKEPLDTAFDCLFCHHSKSISCKLDHKDNVGHLSCKVCGVSFQTNIHHLSAPVDVYSDWIDAANDVQGQASRLSDED